MRYGHFSDDGREFIVTAHSPPRPRINYLSNEIVGQEPWSPLVTCG